MSRLGHTSDVNVRVKKQEITNPPKITSDCILCIYNVKKNINKVTHTHTHTHIHTERIRITYREREREREEIITHTHTHT